MIQPALDVILVLVIVEACALVLYRRRTGRGPAPRALLANLAAGFLLMLAVRVALAGATPTLAHEAGLGGILLLALVAHLVDLALRWPGRGDAGARPSA